MVERVLVPSLICMVLGDSWRFLGKLHRQVESFLRFLIGHSTTYLPMLFVSGLSRLSFINGGLFALPVWLKQSSVKGGRGTLKYPRIVWLERVIMKEQRLRIHRLKRRRCCARGAALTGLLEGLSGLEGYVEISLWVLDLHWLEQSSVQTNLRPVWPGDLRVT